MIGLMLGVAILPLVAASVFLFTRFWNREMRNAEVLAQQRAQVASKEIGALLLSRFAAIDQLGLAYDTISFDISLRAQLLDRFLSSHDEVTDIVVVNSRGKEIEHRSKTRTFSSRDLADRSQNVEFAAVKEKGYYLGPVYISQQKSFFLIGQPLVTSSDHTARSGMIFALLDANILQEKLKTFSREINGGSIYIVNDKGAVIAHPNFSYLVEGKDFSHVPSVRLAMTKEAVPLGSLYYNEGNEKVIGAGLPVVVAFSAVRQFVTNWFVIAELPVSFALAQGVGMRAFTLEVVLALLAVAACAGVVVANRFAAPLEALESAFQQVNTGNIGHHLPENTKIGTNMLAGFNALSDQFMQAMADITYQKDAVASEKKKLILALSRMSDAVIVINERGEIILANQKAEQFTGLPIKEMLGKRLEGLIRFYENEKQLTVADVCSVGRSNALRSDGARMMRIVSDTREHTAVVTSSALSDISSEEGCLFTFHDMTHERFLEKVKSDFIAITAHQLRTPLAEIKWSMDMLLGAELGKTTREQKQFLRRSSESNERMIRIVDDLLNATTLEEAQYHYEKNLSDFKKIIHDMCLVQREQARAKNISLIEKKTRLKVPLVSADVNAMKVVLKNLIENAISYTPDGGTVTIRLAQAGNALQVAVADSGIGVDSKERDQLFTKFFRGKKAFKMETTGNGLGLYIVKKIIEAHGGTVWVHSEPDKGSTFGFEIPV